MTAPADAVTALFVPGDRPERFAKAVAAGPDLVIIDLEDAVAPSARSAALEAIQTALSPESSSTTGATPPTLRAMVRINPIGSATSAAEVDALRRLSARHDHGLVGVMVPKAEDPGAIAELAATLTHSGGTGLAVIPLVESARGALRAVELAAVPGVTRLAFGALDFMLDVAADPRSGTVAYAGSQLVIASRAAGIAAPLDSPSTELRSHDLVLESARAGRAMGFGGKLCIHPAQLAAVRTAFAPTAAELEWARAVAGAADGVVQIDGRMVDRPLIERARRILSSTD